MPAPTKARGSRNAVDVEMEGTVEGEHFIQIRPGPCICADGVGVARARVRSWLQQGAGRRSDESILERISSLNE